MIIDIIDLVLCEVRVLLLTNFSDEYHYDDFPYFGSSIAHLEPELHWFEDGPFPAKSSPCG